MGKDSKVDTGNPTCKGEDLPKAFRSWRLILVFVAIAAVGAAADLWSKHAVFNSMLNNPSIGIAAQAEKEYLVSLNAPEVPPVENVEFTRFVLQRLHISEKICPGLEFTLSTNPGVVFGFDAIPRWAVNLATACMIVVVVVFFLCSPRNAYWLHVALALILGGAIGNLYDRLYSSVPLPGLTPIKYHVRDFIDCSSIGYKWVFNIADAWLVIGVAMIIIWQFRLAQKEKKAKAKQAQKA